MKLFLPLAMSLWLVLPAQEAPPQPALPKLDEVEAQMRRFTRVFAAVEAEAAEPLNPDAAFYGGALPAMLRKLDPHSMFLDPSQFEQLQQMEKSEQKGFGSVVSILPGRVIILQTLPGTPSSKAGLGPGDEILAVNNIPLGGLDPEQLVGLLGEARQRKALVHVRRPGNVRILDFTLTPETLAAPSVDRAFFLANGVGFIRVSSFDEKTGKDLQQAIENLGGAKLKGLVLDLRGNPGGVMGAALEAASLFLKPGEKILGVRGRRVREEDAQVAKDATPYTFPLAVLMNGKSASASEIVAGALQDHKRAAILGEQSYGKGLVQSVYPLSSNSAMLLTTAYYFTPSGRSIQRPLQDAQIDENLTSGRKVGGITPDERVLPDEFTRLRAYLENSASFTAFATEYAGKHKVEDGFKVDLRLLDEFQGFLFQRNVRPSLGEWLQDKEWIRSRLEQEIVTIALGVPKGDEVEMRRDPVVRAALGKLDLR